MLCVLAQNNEHFFKNDVRNLYLFEKLKNGALNFSRAHSYCLFTGQSMQNIVLIYTSRTSVCFTKNLLPFLNLSRNLLQNALSFFKKSDNYFEIVHKTFSILVEGAVPL